MLELLSRAILPRLSLRQALQHWDAIGHHLAEPHDNGADKASG